MNTGQATQQLAGAPKKLTLKGVPVDPNLRILGVATLVNTLGNGALTPDDEGDIMTTETTPRELTLTRTFVAPRQLVWDAYTVPEQLARWGARHHAHPTGKHHRRSAPRRCLPAHDGLRH
jgi:hypothetical protein